MSKNLGEKYPKGVLRLIISQLIKEMGEYASKDPYKNESEAEITDVLVKFGITNVEYGDLGFWSKLVELNKDKTSYDELEIPQSKDYSVYLDQNLVTYSTETYRHNINSYDLKYVKSMILNDEYFDFYGGTYIDNQVYDSETGDFSISDIIEESRKNKKPLVETSGSKRKQIQQLTKMKSLIEERLRLLSL